MFSGIVETTGFIQSINEQQCIKRFVIYAPAVTNDMQVGDSIAVNGVCLTVVEFDANTFHVELVPETLRRTTLGELIINQLVNLERSLQANQRVGGHFVQGHVDGVGEILEIAEEGDAWVVKVSLPPAMALYIVNKGFVTLDGMSITVIDAKPDYFTVTLIPHTRTVTIAKSYLVGRKINLEVDMTAKYIIKFLEQYHEKN